MLASYKWLCRLAGFNPTPAGLTEKFTFSGLEVAEVVHRGPEFDNVVVGEIKEKQKHPKRDRLNLVEVDAGNGETISVVCGASNCPLPGAKVVLAKVGALFGDFKIEPVTLAGAPSSGMLCSQKELNIGPEDDGIIILDTDAKAGTPIKDALDLEDWIFELEVTPNRPDALYHIGLAREMCVLFDRPFVMPVTDALTELDQSVDTAVSIKITDPEMVLRYGGAVVKNVSVKPSPFNIQYLLHNLGIRPISNIVDMTNYILMEYGQPLHAFDLDKLEGAQIITRNAREGEKMVTLDGEERTFTKDDILICDSVKPVAVAGVMGGLDTEVTDTTVNILIECANFNPSAIRKTSKRLKLSSDSSYRFERGIDPNHIKVVLDAATSLTGSLAGGAKLKGIADVYPVQLKPVQVMYRPSRYEHIMGHSVSLKESKRILSGLGAVIKDDGENLIVDIPTFRPDMDREIDLIEEVARIAGMDNIIPRLPNIQAQVPDRAEFDFAKKTKEILSKAGLQEAVTYSFIQENYLKALNKNEDTVLIANPLNKERATLRTTLIAGLLENLKRTKSRYMHTFAQFEVARTYHNKDGENLPVEILRVSAVMDGAKKGWLTRDGGVYDFYDIKGVARLLVHNLTGYEAEFKKAEVSFMHPKRCMKVLIDNREIGVVGELHPASLKTLKLDRGAVAFEFTLMDMYNLQKRPEAKALSEFPPMERDVALVTDKNMDAGIVLEALKNACGELAQDINLFDIYEGENLGENKKSMAFSVIYRSLEKTLTDKEIDAVHNKAVASVCKTYNLKVR